MASPEYVTMIESTVELTEDFSNNLQFIADALFAKHYISPSVKEEALNPIYPTSRERASKLVSVITSRIKIQPEAFKTFVALLDPRYFRLSLTALKKKYKNRSGKDLLLPEPILRQPPLNVTPTHQQNVQHLQEGNRHSEQVHGGAGESTASAYLPSGRHIAILNNAEHYGSQPANDQLQNGYPLRQVQHQVQNGYPPRQVQHQVQNGSPPRQNGYGHYHVGSTYEPSAPAVMAERFEHVSETGLDWIPELDDLLFYERNGKKVRVIARIASEWEKLALALSIEAYIMRTIKRNHGNSCEDACTDLLRRWLEGEGREPKTWATLVEALKEVPDVETVSAISDVLNQ